MSVLETAVVVIALVVVLIAYQLSRFRFALGHVALFLQSLDEEVFHLAQEQNPHYGCCSECGRRTTVSHVVPKDGSENPSGDLFYCQSCWWLASDVIAGDEKKYYKNRMTKEDLDAARIGPG